MGRVEEIRALPVGTKLPPLRDMPGFAEWRASPVTEEVLARFEAMAQTADERAARFKPCTCGAPIPPDKREVIAFDQGIAGGARALAQQLRNEEALHEEPPLKDNVVENNRRCDFEMAPGTRCPKIATRINGAGDWLCGDHS